MANLGINQITEDELVAAARAIGALVLGHRTEANHSAVQVFLDKTDPKYLTTTGGARDWKGDPVGGPQLGKSAGPVDWKGDPVATD